MRIFIHAGQAVETTLRSSVIVYPSIGHQPNIVDGKIVKIGFVRLTAR
jgi:hypothetical protein